LICFSFLYFVVLSNKRRFLVRLENISAASAALIRGWRLIEEIRYAKIHFENLG